MKYLQILLLYSIGIIFWLIILIIIYPTLAFLGGDKSFRLVDEIDNCITNGIDNLLK